MAINLEEYKMKKLSRIASEIGSTTRKSGIAFAEGLDAFAYMVRKIDSRIKANEKELNKYK